MGVVVKDKNDDNIAKSELRSIKHDNTFLLLMYFHQRKVSGLCWNCLRSSLTLFLAKINSTQFYFNRNSTFENLDASIFNKVAAIFVQKYAAVAEALTLIIQESTNDCRKKTRSHAVSGMLTEHDKFEPDGTADYNLLSETKHVRSNMHLQVNYTKYSIISYVLFVLQHSMNEGFVPVYQR